MGSIAYVKLNFMLKAEAAVFYRVSQNNPGAPCKPADAALPHRSLGCP